MPRAHEQGYDKGPLRINAFNSPVITGGVEWRDGNVWYVPLDGSIADAITAATSGDTIQLGAGTYTITSTLTVNKKLHIKGMGRGVTTILTTTANVSNLTLSTEAGTVISDLTINNGSAITGSTSGIVTSVSGIVSNVEIISTATSADNVFIGINAIGSNTVNVYDTSFNGSGVAAGNYFIWSQGTATVNAFNCVAVGSNAVAGGVRLIRISAAGATINTYNCAFSSATDVANGVVELSNGTFNDYGSVISGSGASAFDVKRTAGTLTLYNTTLVNNKTSGTITYGGTVASGQINIGGTALNKTQLDALLELL